MYTHLWRRPQGWNVILYVPLSYFTIIYVWQSVRSKNRCTCVLKSPYTYSQCSIKLLRPRHPHLQGTFWGPFVMTRWQLISWCMCMRSAPNGSAPEVVCSYGCAMHEQSACSMCHSQDKNICRISRIHALASSENIAKRLRITLLLASVLNLPNGKLNTQTCLHWLEYTDAISLHSYTTLKARYFSECSIQHF